MLSFQDDAIHSEILYAYGEPSQLEEVAHQSI